MLGASPPTPQSMLCSPCGVGRVVVAWELRGRAETFLQVGHWQRHLFWTSLVGDLDLGVAQIGTLGVRTS